MKERPILMTAESVKAILDGRKTMTRRVIKRIDQKCDGLVNTGGNYWQMQWLQNPDKPMLEICNVKCPYGQVGDRLWVREAWATEKLYDDWKPADIPTWAFISYKASKEWGSYIMPIIGKTRPSIFMPRWASRLTLEITGVRVERLQEISREDIRAEGIVLPVSPRFTPSALSELHQEFEYLWDSLNAKRGYGWDKNPWVWVIKFDNIGVRVK